MKVINVIKCEFIKNYTLKKILLIILFLIISVIGITEFESFSYNDQEYFIENELNSTKSQYELYKNVKDDSLRNQYYYDCLKNKISIFSDLVKMDNINQNSWQYVISYDILQLFSDNKVINQLLLKENKTRFDKMCNQDDIQYDEYDSKVSYYCGKYPNELIKILKQNEENILIQRDILKANKYYKYVEYLLVNGKIGEEAKTYFEEIVDNKIEKVNYIVNNVDQRTQLFSNSMFTIMSENEFNQDSYILNEFSDYNSYLRYNSLLKKSNLEKLEIVTYSINTMKKHDINFNKYDSVSNSDKYMTSKVAVNQILNLSIVVILLVILTSGGIVSDEYIKGTDKLLLTSPMKRWKILLGKFLYLIIHTYIIWFMALILLSLYAGFRFGFNDLFSPKLVYIGGKVVEVNYYLNIIKNMFICSIPIISFISIMFALSSITLKTSATIGISVLLVCVSPLLWNMIASYKLFFLSYTPLPYFNYSLVIDNYNYYIDVLKYVNISKNMGLIISLISTILFFVITITIYAKRDIKN